MPETQGDGMVDELVDGLFEDLSAVDLGLEDDVVLEVAAKERLNFAMSAQTLKERLSTIEMTVKVNRAAASPDLLQWEKQEREIRGNLNHCLRGIQSIDNRHPRAKVRMKELANPGK